MAKAFESVLRVKYLKSYKGTVGKEFFNKSFQALMKKQYHSFRHCERLKGLGGGEAVERFNLIPGDGKKYLNLNDPMLSG